MALNANFTHLVFPSHTHRWFICHPSWVCITCVWHSVACCRKQW